MRRQIVCFGASLIFATALAAQTTENVSRPEEQQKEHHKVARQEEKTAQHASAIEFRGETAFKDKELRSQVKEQITTIDDFGLSAARADDLAFFLELFYRKHGYTKVKVKYQIQSGNQLVLDIDEGPVMTLGNITFDGNVNEPTDKLFEFAVGPTRERYSRLQKNLPFVAADLEEGADLVHRLYIAEGFVEAKVDRPDYVFHDEENRVDAVIHIHEGRQHFFGAATFHGRTIVPPDELRKKIGDLLEQPYTDARVADIPRRLQGYYKQKGYYDAKVDATADPARAGDGKVPVEITIAPGPLYHFGESAVTGLKKLNPTFVIHRFDSLAGKTYNPELLDERFRTLMRTGLFNLLQIKPVPQSDGTLNLDISAEEAKSKEFGLLAGYGTYEGLIGGVQFRERNLFGTGRPLTTSIEVSQRSYKGEVLYEDPFLFNTEFGMKLGAKALTFDFDGYSKFELGGRVELNRTITKQFEVGGIFSVRHVEVTSAEIDAPLLGRTSYLINSLGFTQTLDLRQSPLVSPRGFVFNTTVDIASRAFGSDVELVRTTGRIGYFLPFGPPNLTPGVTEDKRGSGLQRWFQQSSIAFGARAGIVHSLNDSGGSEPFAIPIDERFFNGGANSVRSFGERDLGPHDNKGNPIGGEFYSVFNAEYTFPIYGELQGAVFADAGNLLPTAEDPSLNDMRYALGFGLRYKLPVGPIRLDYGFNPSPRPFEAAGAFHFSFGFAF